MDNTTRLEELKKQAEKDYEELKKIVENYHGPFYALCRKVKGFNYTTWESPHYFDVNWGVINTTIYADEDIKNIYHISDVYDIWDDGDGTEFSKMVATIEVK